MACYSAGVKRITTSQRRRMTHPRPFTSSAPRQLPSSVPSPQRIPTGSRLAAEPSSPHPCPRRSTLLLLGLLPSALPAAPAAGADGEFVNMEALKGKDYGKTPMRFPDYETAASGLQFKDLREGSGAEPEEGDLCVIDWQGYTVGYYGRVFEARNKPKGSSFEGNDKAFLRVKLGSTKLIAGVEEGLKGMKAGGVRRLIIPEKLGYPNGDFKTWEPSPTTFAGKRTLDFVLNNQGMIDKTLLIDIELLKIA